jgi:queuine/archaeosine tRNA-ribosyltransferase
VCSSDLFTFYFGAASGSARKALRELNEPNVMINYATKNNTPWGGIERLFIDSGGYSFMKGKGEYETDDEAYVAFLENTQPELFALRDYPCEPEILDEHSRTVADHQRMTTERHRSLLGMIDDCDGQPVAVLQGWETDDYLRHLETYKQEGLLTGYLGIGSVCRRNSEQEIRDIILSVAAALPDGHDLHAFGVKSSVLQFSKVREALSSADSQSYEMQAQWGSLKRGLESKTWRDSAFEYLKQKRRIRATLAGGHTDDEQMTLAEVSHD